MVEEIPFSQDWLAIDAAVESARIATAIQEQVLRTLRRKGVVVGLSGGIDSAVVAALAVRALGRDRVLALLMPERDSSPESLRLGRLQAEALGIAWSVEEIEPALRGLGCYRRQMEAVRVVFPEFREDYKFKLVLPSLLDGGRISVTRVTIEGPDGVSKTARLPAAAYWALIAATNFKQRVRKTMEYFHADRLQYAVAGTPNRLEYDQGFFVKQGDGAADFKPIAHLYKSQVYALAAHLDVPDEIRRRPPTTDTFSLAQTQEEFYFALPHQLMDLCLLGHNRGVASAAVARASGLSEAQVDAVYRDIEAKRRATWHLRAAPLFVGARAPDFAALQPGEA